MLKKLPRLRRWLIEKQKPGLEIAYVKGEIIDWTMGRLAQFGVRRLIMLILFSVRFLFCLKKFVWFSWHDLIYQTSIIYMIVGIHYGSLENFKKSYKGIRTARLMTFLISLIILIFVLPPLVYKMFYLNYTPNVFDEARLIIAFKGLSQIYRNLENAIQVRRGTPPIPLGRLIISESALVLSFVAIVHYLGTSPFILFWILLLDSLVQEAIQWPWILSQPYRNKVAWFSFKDFINRPEINTEFLLSCFIGALIYSERFMLQGLTSNLGHNAVYYYYFMLPIVSISWRLPHFFHRYFRKKHGTLTKQMSLAIFWILFSFLFILGIIQFILITLFFKSDLYFPTVILCLGPTSAILAYCWYRGKSIEFLVIAFWILNFLDIGSYVLPILFTSIWILSKLLHKIKIRKWVVANFKLKKCNANIVIETFEKRMKEQKIPFEINLIFGRIYELRSPEAELNLLKKELFSLTLAEIEFNPSLEDKLLVNKDEKNFIPLGSFKMRKLVASNEESETFLKMIQKSLSSGNKKSVALKNGSFTFGIDSKGKYGAIFSK